VKPPPRLRPHWVDELVTELQAITVANRELLDASAMAAMSRSKGGVALQGAEPNSVLDFLPLSEQTANSWAQIRSMPGVLLGYALRETTGLTEAVVELHSAVKNTQTQVGSLLCPISLAPGETVRDWFGPGGVSFIALSLVVASGTVDGSIWTTGVS
jgi:hypothetical protein